MDRFVRCDLSEFRSFVFQYAHHNPDQHDAIQAVLETVIQSELKSSTHGSQQAPDATASTPLSHLSPHILNDSEPQCGADPPGTDQNKSTGRRRGAKGKDQNQPTGRRCGTKGKPPPIIVPDTVISLPSAGAGECPRGQETTMRGGAGSIRPTSPVASERTSPTHTTDGDHSAVNVDLRRKRRKRGSGAVAAPDIQAELETTAASRATESSTSVQPHTSDEAAVEVAALSPRLVHKLGLIGGIEVMRDLRQTLSRLRSRSSQDLLIPSCVTSTPYMSGLFDTFLSLQTAQILSMLQNELEITEIGEQLFRFRKRIAQSRFFEFYELAQKRPERFLQATSQTTEGPSCNVTSKQASRLKSRVLNRIVDFMFPDTAHTDEDTVTAEGSFGQMQRQLQRNAAVKKAQDWRRNGKPWSAMIQRFGEGILLLLPKSLSDENIRRMTKGGSEDLLNLMESILSQSKVLLRSANALSPSLVRHQAPAEILRVETDRTLMEIGAKYGRQDLDALLEPCRVVTPSRKSAKCTVQAEEHSGSYTLGLSRSPLRRIHVSASRPIDSNHLTSLGTPKAILSQSKSPAKRGFSTMNSNLSSPARLLTPSFFQSTVRSNLSSPRRLPPPIFLQSAVNSSLSSPARLPTPAFFHEALGDLRTPSVASPV